MDSDERDICNYLKSWPGQFISGREISRRAAGKWKFRQEPNWAHEALSRLVEQDIIESDSTGHYRLRKGSTDASRKPKKWVSPQIKRILERSGKDFGYVLELEDPDELLEKA